MRKKAYIYETATGLFTGMSFAASLSDEAFARFAQGNCKPGESFIVGDRIDVKSQRVNLETLQLEPIGGP